MVAKPAASTGCLVRLDSRVWPLDGVMYMNISVIENPDSNSPLFVHDVDRATCIFCPYGTNLKTGDQALICEGRSASSAAPRERVVEIKAVKIFRSTGRRVTLDLMMASNSESEKIAEDSAITLNVLLAHRAGTANFDPKHPPVVVYFMPAATA